MTIKELYEAEDCSLCEFYKNGDCTGGWKSDGMGNPIEPPCCSWGHYPDDTEVEDLYREYEANLLEFEEQMECEERKKRERQERAKKAAKTRREIRTYCCLEIAMLKQAQKVLQSYEAAERFASMISSAFNLTNEMFRYNERAQVDPKISKKIIELREAVESARKAYFMKRKEFYAKRKQQMGMDFEKEE